MNTPKWTPMVPDTASISSPPSTPTSLTHTTPQRRQVTAPGVLRPCWNRGWKTTYHHVHTLLYIKHFYRLNILHHPPNDIIQLLYLEATGYNMSCPYSAFFHLMYSTPSSNTFRATCGESGSKNVSYICKLCSRQCLL